MNKPIQWTYAQKQALDIITNLIERKINRIVVLHGRGSTGKSFMINELNKKHNTGNNERFISDILGRKLTLSKYNNYINHGLPVILETNMNQYDCVDTELQWAVQFIQMDVLPSFISKVDDKGRIVIRSDIREDRNIKPGDKVRIIEFEKIKGR